MAAKTLNTMYLHVIELLSGRISPIGSRGPGAPEFSPGTRRDGPRYRFSRNMAGSRKPCTTLTNGKESEIISNEKYEGDKYPWSPEGG